MQFKGVYFFGLILVAGEILGVKLERPYTNNTNLRIVQKNYFKAANNPYLDTFLEDNNQIKVSWENGKFDLKLDRKHEFKPPVRMAPFSSVGEPWPLPKHYKSEKEKVLNVKKSTFKISVLNHSCGILTEAINRYKTIIENHIPEEHYDFLYNFNKKSFDSHKKQEESKYNHVTTMADLKIFVREDDCGQPHIDMKESYKLTVKENVTKLIADQVWGALRGLETFSQLLFRRRETDLIFAKETEIEDEPRFPHRGILIDTSRHYIHKFVIKDVLDGMAYNKMNVLHWHIVDDNSFPYQSEVFPKLSEQGAFHPTLVYTIKDIKEIVEYARLRGIRVIPEFDSPGHTLSWLGYPELKSTCYVQDKPLQGPLGPINPARDETYSFMSKLFSEIFDVFPDKFVHLGGDELHDPCWATNPQIIAYLQEHGGIPAAEARTNAANYINLAIGYYFKRLIATLKTTASVKKTKKAFILWEDVLKNTKEIPSDAILQVWLARQQNVRTLNQKGYRALYSSCWYLDNYKRQPMWPEYYLCEPSPYASETEEKGKLLGGEACLWAEYITTDTLMTFMWPRASAPAERLWSPKTTTNLLNAQRRLQEQRCRMIYRGLPTGHISGPDYCLRPRDGPLGGTNVYNSTFVREQDTVHRLSLEDEQNVALLVFSSKHHSLPLVNILLSFLGLYLMIIAAKLWKRKARTIILCPKFA